MPCWVSSRRGKACLQDPQVWVLVADEIPEEGGKYLGFPQGEGEEDADGPFPGLQNNFKIFRRAGSSLLRAEAFYFTVVEKGGVVAVKQDHGTRSHRQPAVAVDLLLGFLPQLNFGADAEQPSPGKDKQEIFPASKEGDPGRPLGIQGSDIELQLLDSLVELLFRH